MSTVLLEISRVEKHYGDFKALQGVSFSLNEGEIVSLLGVNGAGKTTISSIIATLHPATAGDIFFKGQSIYKDISKYRMNIGYCPQKPNLNPAFTVRDNLVFGGCYFGLTVQQSQERAEKLAQELEFTKFLDKMPHTLSGGYKQRVLIARTLIHKPKLVILDEPTVALDPHVRRQIWEILKQVKQQGISILLTTHYLDEAEYLSDFVCVMDKGLIRLVDTPQNLMKTFGKKNLEDVFIQLTEEQEGK